MAYYRAVVRFFTWCDHHQLGQIEDIEPLHVAAYIEALQKDFAKPSVKQHLAAIRMLFDWLVTGGIVATNLAHAVRGPTHVVKRGKTPVLTPEEARALLDSIDISTVVGLRDRALISLMTFTFARVGAVVDMRVEDYYPQGKRWWVRLHEKGGPPPAFQNRLDNRPFRGRCPGEPVRLDRHLS
jgi:integrase/recombinase XerD